MTVRELSRTQLDELKNNLYWNLDGEQYGGLTDEEKRFILGVSHPNDIPDELVFKNYDGIHFVEEDFFCREEDVDDWVNEWYRDCLEHDIPVSPSDVRDIINELIELRVRQKEE